MASSSRLALCGLPACRKPFSLCPGCDHGHRYCSRDCAKKARLAQQREASRRYQRTERGRRSHTARQRRYRETRRKVTHQSPDARQSVPPTGKSTTGEKLNENIPTAARKAPAGTRRHHEQPKYRINNCIVCSRESAFLRRRFLSTIRAGQRFRRAQANRGPPQLATRRPDEATATSTAQTRRCRSS